jgi:hypothetical protein
MKAFLFTPAATDIAATCAGPVDVGLVGLHVVHKTQAFPGWIWETFEQVDTTPADPSNPGPAPPGGWGFFKIDSTTRPNTKPTCPDGTTPAARCDFQPASAHHGTAPNDKTGGPVQAVRTNTIPKSQNQPALGQINSAVKAALKSIAPNNVWQFYQLVEAQWQSPAPPGGPCTQATGFFPACNVANMTMETFQQTNSCLGYHSGATTPGTPVVSSDFTLELNLGWMPGSQPAPPFQAAAGTRESKGASR